MNGFDRQDTEWTYLCAVRGVMKIAANGDHARSSYKEALKLGERLYPALLGDDSVLKRDMESETTRKYRQEASLSSRLDGTPIDPLDLVEKRIGKITSLLNISKGISRDKKETDALKNELKNLQQASSELRPSNYRENDLIFRDAQLYRDFLPCTETGPQFTSFDLPDNRTLMVRVFHPERLEHISGTDVLYELHDRKKEAARVVAIQYKMWEKQTLYLNDARMLKQLDKMKAFLCDRGICSSGERAQGYRFPHCSAFIRPTDKQQENNSKFRSTGYHLPICHLGKCATKGLYGAETLDYENIKDVALPQTVFENLFVNGKVGSRQFPIDELKELYENVFGDEARILLHAREYAA